MIRAIVAALVLVGSTARADTEHAIASMRTCLAGGWAPTTHHWRVQYGFYESERYANAALKKLAKHGVDAQVEQAVWVGDDDHLVVVSVATYRNHAAAERAAEKHGGFARWFSE